MSERGGARQGAGRKKNTFSPSEINNIRARIKGHALIKRLERIALGEAEATSPQVTAALGLLKKIVPDLSSITLSGDADNPVSVVATIERRIVDPQPSNPDSAGI